MEDIRFKVNSKELDGSITTADMTISDENEVSAEVSSEGGSSGGSSTSFLNHSTVLLNAHSENEILEFFNNQDLDYVRNFLFQISQGSETDYFKAMFDIFSKMRFYIKFKKNLKVLDENDEYHNLSEFCANPFEAGGVYVLPDTSYDTMYCMDKYVSYFLVSNADDSNGTFNFAVNVYNPKENIKQVAFEFWVSFTIDNDTIQSTLEYPGVIHVTTQDGDVEYYLQDLETGTLPWDDIVEEFVLYI